MLQGGNSISIHLQPSFRNSLLPLATFPPPASHIDSLVAARIEEVGILHVEQKSNIRAGKRPCALVKTRYEWQLLNWVSGWRKSSGPVTSYLRKTNCGRYRSWGACPKTPDYSDTVWLVKSWLLDLISFT